MAEVGLSTGSLFSTGLPLFDRTLELADFKMDAIEINFFKPQQLFEFKLNKYLEYNLNKFTYISIHAPKADYTYNQETIDILNKLGDLCEIIPVNGIVTHPDMISKYDVLEESDPPILMENMDSRANFGTHPEHFCDIKDNYSFGFVLDTQHAYEQDKTMEVAKGLLDVYGNRLKEFHASGYSSGLEVSPNHAPVYLSENKDAIEKILELRTDAPKIIEGVFTDPILPQVQEELEYIRSTNR